MAFNDEMDSIFLRQERTVRRVGLPAGAGGDWAVAANFNIFNITGGPVRITGMFGHVTAVFAGANATPLIDHVPAGVGLSPLCVIAIAAAFALNTLLIWDGSLTAVSGVLRETGNLSHNQSSDSIGTPATAESWTGGMNIIPGMLQVTNAGAGDATGVVDWYLSYIPLTPESEVTPQ